MRKASRPRRIKGARRASALGPAAKPRKRFGQHFLTDAEVLRRILDCIAPEPSDWLLEIGPGRGALTSLLCDAVERCAAVEIDRDLAALLRARFPTLELFVTDVLAFDFAALPGEAQWRVAGNLPYNISSPLLAKLLGAPCRIKDMHFLFQKEMAERLQARPGAKAWGRLSVLAQHRCRVETLFDVAPESFSPPPKVHSSLVCLQPRANPLPLASPAALDQVLRMAFSARRKRLANALKALQLNWRQIGLDADARPDQLCVADFARIANAVARGEKEIAQAKPRPSAAAGAQPQGAQCAAFPAPQPEQAR